MALNVGRLRYCHDNVPRLFKISERCHRADGPGGSIHNIALNAAFLAAQDGGSVTMPMLLDAARTEFKKLERPMKESDFRWQGHFGVVK